MRERLTSYFIVFGLCIGLALSASVFAQDRIFKSEFGINPPTTIDFAESGFTWRWTLTVPANSTRALVRYLAVREPAQTSAVQSRVASPANGEQAGMFDGLSNAERLSIQNLLVPQL